MSAYGELLRDPRWQRKRLEIMQRDRFRCRECKSGTKPLNVHHINYFPGRAPWDYKDSELRTLCNDCHDHLEADIRSVRTILAYLTVAERNRLIGFGRGLTFLKFGSAWDAPTYPMENVEIAQGFEAAIRPGDASDTLSAVNDRKVATGFLRSLVERFAGRHVGVTHRDA